MIPSGNPPHPRGPDQPVVLIADDEEMICHLARIALEGAGVCVLTAHDGEQALKLSRSFPGRIHILVTDILMPKMNGWELRDQILRERPSIQVLLMSGQMDQQVENGAFLPKPFKLNELKERVWRLLEPLGTPPPVGRDDLESSPDVLWAQVRAARERFTIASSHHKDLIEQAQAARWQTGPDGAELLRQADIAERDALKQYARLLDNFTRSVLRSRPSPG